jgi:hypothetical protein
MSGTRPVSVGEWKNQPMHMAFSQSILTGQDCEDHMTALLGLSWVPETLCSQRGWHSLFSIL